MAGRGAKASGATTTVGSRNSFAALSNESDTEDAGTNISYAAAAAAASTSAHEPSTIQLLTQALDRIKAMQADLEKRLQPGPSSTLSGAAKFKPINKGDTASLVKDLADLEELVASANAKEERRAAEEGSAEVRELVKSVTQLTATLNAKQGATAVQHQTRAPETPATPTSPQQPTSPKEVAAAQRNAEPRVTLNVQHLDQQHPARTESPSSLLAAIGPALNRSKEVRAMSVGRMQSGDLRVILCSKADENRILDDEDEGWLADAFTGQDTAPTLRRPLFPEHRSAVAHGVPFWLDEEGIAADITRVNDVEVASARFFKGRRQRQELQKKHNRQFGSVVIAFKSANDKDKFVTAGRISCGNSRCIVVPYLPTERVQQCDNCQQLGHVMRYCRRSPACRLCGNGHATKDHKCAQCPAASTDGPAAKCNHKRSCCLCGGEHASNDDRCPKRQAWREARRIAHQPTTPNQQ